VLGRGKIIRQLMRLIFFTASSYAKRQLLLVHNK